MSGDLGGYASDFDELKAFMFGNRKAAEQMPKKPAETEDIGAARWAFDTAKGAAGAFAQEAVVEMPQGAWNLAVAPLLGIASSFFTGEEKPVDAYQLDIDLRKTFLSDEERAAVSATEGDFPAFVRGTAENIGTVLGFVWGLPSHVMTKAGRVALTPGMAAEKMAIRKLASDGLKEAIAKATAKGATGALEKSEREALDRATRAYRSGDALNAWRNLAMGGMADDAALVGKKLQQRLLGRLSEDGAFTPGFSVRAVQEMQGFAAMEMLRSPRDPETGELLKGANIEARLGAAFSAAMLAPIYTAVGTGAGVMGGRLVERGWNNRAANIAKGALEGLGFSVFEIGQLMDGIDAAGKGDYSGVLKFLEHAAGSSLGFAFAHGVRPSDLSVFKRAHPEDFMPSEKYTNRMAELGIDESRAQLYALAGINVGIDADTLSTPRGLDRFIRIRHKPSTTEEGEGATDIVVERMDRHNNLTTKTGEEALDFLDDIALSYMKANVESRALPAYGFGRTEHAGVYTSPNSEFNVRMDAKGRLLEQEIGRSRNASWKPAPEGDEAMYRERYGIKEDMKPAPAGEEGFQTDATELGRQLVNALGDAKKMIDYMVKSKALDKKSTLYQVLESVLRTNDAYDWAKGDPMVASEMLAALSSPDMLAALHKAVQTKDLPALRDIADGLMTVAAGEANADVAAAIASGTVVFGAGEREAIRSAARNQKIADALETGEMAEKIPSPADLAEKKMAIKPRLETRETPLEERQTIESRLEGLKLTERDTKNRLQSFEFEREREESNLASRLFDTAAEKAAASGEEMDLGETFNKAKLEAKAELAKRKAGLKEKLQKTQEEIGDTEKILHDMNAKERSKNEAISEISKEEIESLKQEIEADEAIETFKVGEKKEPTQEDIEDAAIEKKWETAYQMIREDAEIFSEAIGWKVDPESIEFLAISSKIDDHHEWATTKPLRKAYEVSLELRQDRQKVLDVKNRAASDLRLRIMRKIKSRMDREDMIFYIQKTGNPFVKGDTFESLKKRMSPEAQEFADKNVTAMFNETWEQMNHLGVFADDTYRQEYMTQMWKRKSGLRPMSAQEILDGWRIITGKTMHEKERVFPTYAEGVEWMSQKGFEPRFNQVQDLIRAYQSNLARAEANTIFLNRLKDTVTDTGNPYVIESKKEVDGYIRIAGHPQLKDIWFHPDISKQMKLVFDWTEGSSGWGKKILSAWFSVKASALRYSMFHFFALGVESLSSDRNPIGAISDWMKFGKDIMRGRISDKHKMKLVHPRTGKTIELGTKDLVNDAIRAGLVIDTPHEYRGSFIEVGLSKYIRGAERAGRDPKVAKFAEKTAKFLFNDVLWEGAFPNLKLQGYAKTVEKLMPNLGKADPKGRIYTLERLKGIAARQVNDAYGGQNWDRYQNAFFASRKTRTLMQIALLSPDWTVSNAKIAFRSVFAKDPLSRKLSAQYMAMSMVVATTINAMGGWLAYHLLMSEEEKAQLDKDGVNPVDWTSNAVSKKMLELGIPISGFRIGKERGRWMYAKTMKQQQEVMRYMTNPFEVGGAKLHPLLKTIVRNFSDRDMSGYPAPWDSDKGFWPTIPNRIIDLMTQWVPLSMGTDVRNIALGKDDPSNQFMFTFPKGAEMTDYQMKETLSKSILAYASDLAMLDAKGRRFHGRRLIQRIRDLKKIAARNGVNYSNALRSSTSLVQRKIWDEVRAGMSAGDNEKIRRGLRMLANIGVTPRQAWTQAGKQFLQLVDEGKARWSYREMQKIMIPEIRSNMKPSDIRPMLLEKKLWGRDWKLEEAKKFQKVLSGAL